MAWMKKNGVRQLGSGGEGRDVVSVPMPFLLSQDIIQPENTPKLRLVSKKLYSEKLRNCEKPNVATVVQI